MFVWFYRLLIFKHNLDQLEYNFSNFELIQQRTKNLTNLGVNCSNFERIFINNFTKKFMDQHHNIAIGLEELDHNWLIWNWALIKLICGTGSFHVHLCWLILVVLQLTVCSHSLFRLFQKRLPLYCSRKLG